MKESADLPFMHIHGRQWPMFRTRVRGSRWVRVTFIAGLVVGAIQFMGQVHTYREALAVKYTPTTYPLLNPEERVLLEDTAWRWSPESTTTTPRSENDVAGTYERAAFLDGSKDWRKLGKGFEGDTFQYGDEVVKVYRKQHAPFRNCVPGTGTELRWPTEISASLILGGRERDGGDHRRISENATFLPVTDYFLSPGNGIEKPKWHFLTPFLPLGGLNKLAKRLKKDEVMYTARDLDLIFRPSLNHLLRGLDEMHTKHHLCHDDVKIDNIFLASSVEGETTQQPNETTHWLLGDLGNVRELGNPYHKSLLWTNLKRNLEDCRSNDVLRLMKSYMVFLRKSVTDRDTFHRQFYQGTEPWSALFWSVWRDTRGHETPVSAAGTLELSTSIFDRHVVAGPEDGTSYGLKIPELRNPLYRLFLGEARILSMTCKHLLKARASENVARKWGLVPLLGVPYSECDTA